jgi:hypothetical protein
MSQCLCQESIQVLINKISAKRTANVEDFQIQLAMLSALQAKSIGSLNPIFVMIYKSSILSALYSSSLQCTEDT